MEEKKPFGEKLESFFAGKGFYIVLLLCVAVIGVSAWSMLSGGGAETAEDLSVAVANIGDAAPVSDAAPAPVTATEAPVSRTQPTPAPTAAPAETPPAATVPEEPAQTTAAVDSAPTYYIWPVSGAVENGYAMTSLVYDRTMRDWRTHDGIDVAADIGTQVRAAAGGTVKSVYNDERYGTTVVLRHGGGLESVYSNLAGTPTVSEGETVSVGQVIGAVGDTALCEIGEVSHLHFAMTRDGISVDPQEYLP